jgi:hypothetical protein
MTPNHPRKWSLTDLPDQGEAREASRATLSETRRIIGRSRNSAKSRTGSSRFHFGSRSWSEERERAQKRLWSSRREGAGSPREDIRGGRKRDPSLIKPENLIADDGKETERRPRIGKVSFRHPGTQGEELPGRGHRTKHGNRIPRRDRRVLENSGQLNGFLSPRGDYGASPIG